MQSISADKIFDGYQFLEAHLAIDIDEFGTIISIHHKNEHTVHYDGMLIPGMINCHCHLELSHLKNELPKKFKTNVFLPVVLTRENL